MFSPMKKLIILLTLTGILAGCASAPNCEAQKKEPRKVAVQLYSLNRFTLEDSIRKLKGLKLDAIECYPGQRLSDKYPNVKVGPTMNTEQRRFMKMLLKDANLKMVSFGVTGAKNEKEIDAICQFVKEMGGERVLTEAPVYYLPMWEKACEKYGLTMCLHHHATNSGATYWDTDFFKKHVKGFKHIKYNPDPGHWSRSGIDPVKSLKEVDGYVASIHFKDQKEFNNIQNQPTPFGKGVLDVKGMLAELDRQGFNGYYVIEYEADWLNNIPAIKECVEYLRNN